MTSAKWATTSSMPWSAIASGLARAASTVSGSPGQPGAEAAYPALVKNSIHGSQDRACSQRPWMNRTGAFSVMGVSSGRPLGIPIGLPTWGLR